MSQADIPVTGTERMSRPAKAAHNRHGFERHEARFGKARRKNMGPGEAWLSLAAGAGLVWGAWRARGKASLPLAAAGASLLYRGSTRRCPVYSAAGIDHSARKAGPDAVGVITIDRPVEELYRFWRDLSNSPKFMRFVESVEILDEKRSRWRGKQIGGYAFDYEAELIEDIPNDGLRWRSAEGAPVDMRGSVRFMKAPADRGTVVVASVVFGRSGGGGIRGWLASPFAHYTIHEDLMRLKQLMEAGEIATAEGQPSGRRSGEHDEWSAPSRKPVSLEHRRSAWTADPGASWS